MLTKNKASIDKISILNPETKIITIQTDANSKVCPRSGWFTNSIVINNKNKKEIKYLLLTLIFSFIAITLAMKIINRGLINSIGWNLGKKGKSNHLFDPFISMPYKSTKQSSKIEIKKM